MNFLDYTNTLLKVFDITKRCVYKKVFTSLNSVSLFLRGVEHGENLTFVGWTKIKKANGSMFQIGSNCFLFSHMSNLIRVNRPCILSAMNKDSRLEIGSGYGFSSTVIGYFSQIKLEKNVRCGTSKLIADSD